MSTKQKQYTLHHEWVLLKEEEINGLIGIIGITKHALEEIGEVVFLKLPEVGEAFSAGEEVAILESTKAAVDLYAPLSGVVVGVNEAILDVEGKGLDLLNLDPEEKGWLFKITPSFLEGEEESLLTKAEYEEMIESV